MNIAPIQGLFPSDPRLAAKLLDIVVDAKRDFGASGSNQTTTGSITAGSNQLSVASAIDFVVGQGISVVNAGPLPSISAPAAPTVTATGTTGTTTWAYAVAALDGKGGETTASPTTTITNGNATLSSTNYNAISWTAVSGAAGYAVYRVTAGGTPNTTGLIAIVSGTTLNDEGLATITPPEGIAATPPASALGDLLVTTVVAINGTTFTLATSASSSVTTTTIYHDDGAAINNAISAVNAAGGGIVYLPAGTYNTSTTISVTSNIILTGAGRGAVVLQPTIADPFYDIVQLTGNYARVYNITVNGRGNSGGPSGAGISTTVGTNCTHYEIAWCEVTNTPSDGIHAYGSKGRVHDNHVHECWRNGIYTNGIETGGPTQYVEIDHNICVNNSYNSVTWDGIDIDPSSQYIDVHDNIVIDNDIIVYDAGAGETFQVKLHDNLIVGSREGGIDIATSASGIMVENNLIFQPVGPGIFVNGPCTRLLIRGNLILGPSTYGIWLSQSRAFIIEGNYIENPSSSSGAASGIYLSGGANTGAVIGNYVRDTRSTVLMSYAIDASGANAPLEVSGNTVGAGVNGTINLPPAAPTTFVRGNPGYNPVGVVTVAVPASGTAVAAAPYDRTFYVTAATGGCTMAIQNGPSITIPASTLGTVHVPAGLTVTPTYTTAPTWVVEGE